MSGRFGPYTCIYPLARLAQLDPASAFLTLRICDPAMGSGHFLVSLVDYLADQTMLATTDASAQVGFGLYRSPLLDRLEAIRERIRSQAAEKGWQVSEAQLIDRQLVRRIILKRVIHGVDKNPMAVELAKLSLWLHTFTVGAPLSFLDHHLRCGDIHVSAKHLPKYLAEFEYRWNMRDRPHSMLHRLMVSFAR